MTAGTTKSWPFPLERQPGSGGFLSEDGSWHTEASGWTYLSGASFKVPGDVTATYLVGTKLQWNDGTNTPGYGVVTSTPAPTYDGTNTTVTMIGNDDYTMANHAITSPKYSYGAAPSGFPAWFNYSPTVVGWSSAPSGATYKWKCRRAVITIQIRQPNVGTSNNTEHTFTLPVPPITAGLLTNVAWGGEGTVIDNGTVMADPGINLSADGTLIVVTAYGSSKRHQTSGMANPWPDDDPPENPPWSDDGDTSRWQDGANTPSGDSSVNANMSYPF